MPMIHPVPQEAFAEANVSPILMYLGRIDEGLERYGALIDGLAHSAQGFLHESHPSDSDVSAPPGGEMSPLAQTLGTQANRLEAFNSTLASLIARIEAGPLR